MTAPHEAYEVLSNPALRAGFDADDDPNDPTGGAGGGGNPFAFAHFLMLLEVVVGSLVVDLQAAVVEEDLVDSSSILIVLEDVGKWFAASLFIVLFCILYQFFYPHPPTQWKVLLHVFLTHTVIYKLGRDCVEASMLSQ